MGDIEVRGMEELLKDLKKLPENIKNKVLINAIRESAKPIIKEAKRLVPREHGVLADSIGVKKYKTRNTNYIWFEISPMRKTVTRKFTTSSGQKWSIKGEVDGWYGHFLEYGTYANLDHPMVRVRKGKLGKRRAKIVAKGAGIKPRAFMRRAYEKEGANTIESVRAYLRKTLPKELEKL